MKKEIITKKQLENLNDLNRESKNKKYFYATLKNQGIMYVDAKKGYLVVEDYDSWYNYTISFKRLTRLWDSLGVWFEDCEDYEIYDTQLKEKRKISKERFISAFSYSIEFPKEEE